MTKLIACVQGDIGDERVVELLGITDLDDVASIVTNVKKGSDSAQLVTVVTDSAQRLITIALGAAPGSWLPDRPKNGVWKIQYELTMTNGDVITWPTDAPGDSIEVLAEQ